MLNWRGPNLLISSGIVSPKEWLFTKVEICGPRWYIIFSKGRLFAKVEIVVYMAHNIQVRELIRSVADLVRYKCILRNRIHAAA